MIGQKFYDDSNKDHWEIIGKTSECEKCDTWICHSLTTLLVMKIYEEQNILRLLSLSMF
jgi:hypothetical protein